MRIIKVVAMLLLVVLLASAAVCAEKSCIISIKAPGNPDARDFYTVKRACETSCANFSRPLPWEFSAEMQEAGSVGSLVARAIFNVEGVDEVFLSPYEITIIKGRAFDWTRLRPRLIRAIDQAILHGRCARSPQAQRPTMSCMVPVIVEACPNNQVMRFHFSQQVSDSQINQFYYPLRGNPFSTSLRELGDTGEGIVRRLDKVDGIDDLFITPYSVSVSLCQSFKWTDAKVKQVKLILQEAVATSNRRS